MKRSEMKSKLLLKLNDVRGRLDSTLGRDLSKHFQLIEIELLKALVQLNSWEPEDEN